MARIGQRLSFGQLVVGQIYKIEVPNAWYDEDEEGNRVGEPHFVVKTYMGKLVTKGDTLRFSNVTQQGRVGTIGTLSVPGPVSTDPIGSDPDDTRPRISTTAKEVLTEKALAGVGPDVAAKIRGLMGGRKKTRKARRKTKKTLRRK
jgi:hypothetical protein